MINLNEAQSIIAQQEAEIEELKKTIDGLERYSKRLEEILLFKGNQATELKAKLDYIKAHRFEE